MKFTINNVFRQSKFDKPAAMPVVNTVIKIPNAREAKQPENADMESIATDPFQQRLQIN